MLSRSKKIIGVGDKVLVAIDGAVEELEVISTDNDPKQGKVSFLKTLAQAFFGKKYPERITVKLPNGKNLECRLFRVAHY